MSDSVKSLEIDWTTVVTRADPDWQRDGRHIPQLEPGNLPPKRELITVDWQNTGPYESRLVSVIEAEDEADLQAENDTFLTTES